MSAHPIATTITAELQLRTGQVERTINLLDEGNTIPFIARYRKEMTDGLDEEQLPPGHLWQELLEEQIARIKCAAVFVGKSGVGPCQDIELRAFLTQFMNRRCPVIPVILAECVKVPRLPFFLSQFTWVDFRKSTPDPFGQLRQLIAVEVKHYQVGEMADPFRYLG